MPVREHHLPVDRADHARARLRDDRRHALDEGGEVTRGRERAGSSQRCSVISSCSMGARIPNRRYPNAGGVGIAGHSRPESVRRRRFAGFRRGYGSPDAGTSRRQAHASKDETATIELTLGAAPRVEHERDREHRRRTECCEILALHDVRAGARLGSRRARARNTGASLPHGGKRLPSAGDRARSSGAVS
jgi:hypothetical protein